MSEHEEDDPIIASYDILITDAQIRRFLLQYPDRQAEQPYNDATMQKPTELRLKPKTGLVEVDIPINTRINYDERKGIRYGNALRKSNIVQQGGTHGIAGGFNTIGVPARARMEEVISKTKGDEYGDDIYDEDQLLLEDEDKKAAVIMGHQTLGGRVKAPVDGDPIYMLGAFKENQLHLAPLSAVVQLRPQLHHLDAFDEITVKAKASKAKQAEEGEPEARAIDVKVKSAEGDTGGQSNNELLKRIQEEKWEKYEWIDENDQESWEKYEEYMFNLTLEESPQLQSAIEAEDYIDSMSAPRVDPVHPELTGWAIKSRREKRGKPSKPAEVVS
ncbi:hypothetical protein VTO42DRAFT_4579 [Malbranchea cinnamomea]